MSDPDEPQLERRVLVVPPTSRDAYTTQTLLASAGIPAEICASFDAMMAEAERGVAAILLPEETVSSSHSARLSEMLSRQPAWSDLPVLLLARPGAKSPVSAHAARIFGNVTLLERPVQVATLLSAIRTALRSRDRQLQIRGLLRERAEAEASLRRADQRKDEFLATLGHELRNPLAPLVTGLHFLKASGVDDPRVLRITPVLERQLQHLVRLVDDLLEISRITRGLVDIRREPLDLVAVVRAAVDTSRPVLDAASHTLNIELPTEPITIAGDGVRLTQVFANLLTNAAKYTNAGGHVWLTVRRERDRATVSVRDDGIGISSPYLESVFDMFTQVDRSNRRAQGGLGIGLTLVRSLVALHGGRVRARSAGAGQGSEFVVELPVISLDVWAPDPSRALAPFPSQRVLIVDDNEDAADTLAALLRSLGTTVAVAHSGPTALEQLPIFAPDAVLLDIGMPGMDGYAVARHIRATAGATHVTLIALTGWGLPQDVRKSQDAGFDHHLVKPPDIEKLRALLGPNAEAANDPAHPMAARPHHHHRDTRSTADTDR